MFHPSSCWSPLARALHHLRAAVAQTLVGPLATVDGEVFGKPEYRRGESRTGLKVDVLVLEAAPQSLNEHVVPGRSMLMTIPVSKALETRQASTHRAYQSTMTTQ